MENYREALGMGMELTGYFLASYWFHPSLAKTLAWDKSLTLTLLMGLSLSLWTLRAYFKFSR